MSRFLVQSHFPRYALPTLLGILIVSGLYASSLSSYLLFHSLVELFCIVTALVIFVLAWHTRSIQDNQYLLFVGIALLGTAAIELVHALAYKGMGVFAGSSADLPTQLWIAFRYLFSISLLIAPLFIRRRFRAWRMLALYSGLTIALLVSIFSGLFPACFVEGSGLTPFKINSEYVIALIFVASLGLLIANRQSFDGTVFGLMAGSIVSSIASELAFTEYVSVFGLANIIGHFFLLASMVLIYRALAITGIVEPSSLLFRNLKMSEAALQRAHDELKNSEAEITAMIENVPIIMLLVDRERRVQESERGRVPVREPPAGRHARPPGRRGDSLSSFPRRAGGLRLRPLLRDLCSAPYHTGHLRIRGQSPGGGGAGFFRPPGQAGRDDLPHLDVAAHPVRRAAEPGMHRRHNGAQEGRRGDPEAERRHGRAEPGA